MFPIFFFFQAEDGIRDLYVTGVQTCALPIWEVEGALFYEGSGDSGFLLFPTGGRPSGQHTQMAWFVKDIAATVAELRRRGVRFEEYDFPGLKTVDGIADLGYEKSAWFRDSEGNLLALGQLV